MPTAAAPAAAAAWASAAVVTPQILIFTIANCGILECRARIVPRAGLAIASPQGGEESPDSKGQGAR